MTKPISPAAWGTQLHKFWRTAGMSLPVDVGLLATEYSKKYTDPIVKVLGQDMGKIDGMLVQRQRGDWCIVYNRHTSVQGRINFTLGHELGHYILHRNVQTEFQCSQKEIFDYNGAASRALESQANRFSSYLLMPIDDFRAQMENTAVSIEALRHCADRYNVSLSAATIKWLEFTTEPAMLIAARDGFVLWSIVSESARRMQAYIRPGTALDPNVELHISSSATGDSKRTVPIGVWHSAYAAQEFSIVSDRYDMALFLVWLLPDGVDYEEEEALDVLDFMRARASAGRG
ncbi:ImmA/IrrE family metallo-endopeptidase [Bordetella petrii]|uniref:IrrE N-terminal-like domain-containing protein n=1 Tax=Bordetella petrii (strain ATCC BAA-461 / DSM 12804 / CCUG 43448 / CIP 107267 / Se-1111R) TaxID=340100 RepID=A9IF83_BORPD|nr:ImmA/IrrE family metallo-endopeptidase [Bordetella petrii]CAP44989.1 hypothetical protein Bpet4638 [Bordetella petrii]